LNIFFIFFRVSVGYVGGVSGGGLCWGFVFVSCVTASVCGYVFVLCLCVCVVCLSVCA